MNTSLESQIGQLYEHTPEAGYREEHYRLFERFLEALDRGEARAASPENGAWRVHGWVKQGILLGFRMGRVEDCSGAGPLRFFDKHTYPLRRLGPADGVRVVPGGSSIREGVYLGRGVTCMPPMFINVGAWVGDGTMIDSHALVGSCAQVGKRVHVSAGSQIGGVLEPVGALPVIIEDDVLVGGSCGVYEGALVREGAILAAGTILTGGTPVFDLVRETVYRREGDRPLEIPPGAVLVPGARAVRSVWGSGQGLSVFTPVIVKYRDSRTEESVRLEDLLR